MRIEVDQHLCIGAASCVAIAAQTFGLNLEGKVYILHENEHCATTTERGEAVNAVETAEMDPREVILKAARSCPVCAIKLFEENGTEVLL